MPPARLELPIDALVSYHYFRADEVMNLVMGPGKYRMIADSGAFSAFSQGAKITLSEYAAWCRKWRPHLFWIASLDVFGNPEATLANFRELRDRHQVESVPTIHVGCDPKWLDVYAAEGVDFVGLGGMVGLGPRVGRWLVHVVRYARDRHPGMRFHAWGMTSPRLLDQVPIYSADSSGLVSGPTMYARLRLYDPRLRKHAAIRLDGQQPHQYRRLFTEVYGIDPGTVSTSSARNRPQVLRLGAHSTQLYAAALRRRHQVTAPTWSINPHAAAAVDVDEDQALVGPRLHLVSTQPKDFPRILGLPVPDKIHTKGPR